MELRVSIITIEPLSIKWTSQFLNANNSFYGCNKSRVSTLLCSVLGGNALGTNVASLREFPFSQSFHFRSSDLSAQTKAPHSRAQVRPGSFLYFCSTSQALWRKQRIHQKQALQQTQSEQRDVLRQRQFCITCADLRRRGALMHQGEETGVKHVAEWNSVAHSARGALCKKHPAAGAETPQKRKIRHGAQIRSANPLAKRLIWAERRSEIKRLKALSNTTSRFCYQPSLTKISAAMHHLQRPH